MKISQLKQLKAVCQTGNISKVADDLFMSRSAVSKSLRELESEVGLPLFIRTNSGITLTPDGCVFYEKSMEILKMLDALELEMSQMREELKEQNKFSISIGITPSSGVTVFPEFYEELGTVHPEIIVNLMEYSWRQSEIMLEEGTMDFNLTSDVETLPDTIEYLELFDTELCFCVSGKHRLAENHSVTMEDIKNEPLILMDTSYYRESFLDRLYTQYGNIPRIKLRSRQIPVIKRMTAGGICSAIQIRGVIDDGRDIVALSFEPKYKAQIYITWKKDRSWNKACREFLEFARAFHNKRS